MTNDRERLSVMKKTARAFGGILPRELVERMSNDEIEQWALLYEEDLPE